MISKLNINRKKIGRKKRQTKYKCFHKTFENLQKHLRQPGSLKALSVKNLLSLTEKKIGED